MSRIIEKLGENQRHSRYRCGHCGPVKNPVCGKKNGTYRKVIECPNIDFFSAIDYEISKMDSETLRTTLHNIW
ncbi:MAG: hypothetical protein CM1200mP28_04840 [Deltaproteobacteria bacterium]|nr:MAG: hypothetical protein CM1200mP28_04840 [Deltaproteobacteria bacterium]